MVLDKTRCLSTGYLSSYWYSILLSSNKHLWGTTKLLLGTCQWQYTVKLSLCLTKYHTTKMYPVFN